MYEGPQRFKSYNSLLSWFVFYLAVSTSQVCTHVSLGLWLEYLWLGHLQADLDFLLFRESAPLLVLLAQPLGALSTELQPALWVWGPMVLGLSLFLLPSPVALEFSPTQCHLPTSPDQDSLKRA